MREKAKNLINGLQKRIESKRAIITAIMFALFAILSLLNNALFLKEIILCGFIICSIMIMARYSQNPDF